jgi:F-box-like
MLTVQRSNTGNLVARRRKLLWVEAGQGSVIILFTSSSWFITNLGGTGSDSDRLYARVTIGKLPDDVLLEIFVCLVGPQLDYNPGARDREGGWRTLVHVCKQWRSVVFSSPRRLDLRLYCTTRRPVKKLLKIWPPLPIVIFAFDHAGKSPRWGVSNLVTALKQHNRVWRIEIWGVPVSLSTTSVAMKPFPALTSLYLSSKDERLQALPDSFLGGSAPRLQEIGLIGIPFPGIGKLLLSATDLVHLALYDIPHSGYISPEAMVASLSTLTRLEKLHLGFRSPRSRAVRENRHPSPLTRVFLPALIKLHFKGDSEYLEDIMSRIDAPLLNDIDITFFNQLVFDTPQLRHFISRTGIFSSPDRAQIYFDDGHVAIELFPMVSLKIPCQPSDWQLSSLSQLYHAAISPLPTLERLEIRHRREYWEDDMENILWLDVLHLFPSVKDLVLSEELFRLVVPALDEINGERVTEILPVLQNIVIKGPQPSEPDNQAIGKFIATRQILGSPVTVQHLDD